MTFSFYSDNEVCCNNNNDAHGQDANIICSFPTKENGGYAASFSSAEMISSFVNAESTGHFNSSYEAKFPYKFSPEANFSFDSDNHWNRESDFSPSFHKIQPIPPRKVKFI